jgi:diacylglycerol kinase family enzyme
LVSIGNSRRTGGGFYLNPDALLDDGLLDFGIAAAASRLRIVSLLVKALQGAHTSDPLLTMARCRRMEIITTAPVPVHVDGEVISRAASRMAIGLEPARLQLIVPPSAAAAETRG